MLDLPAAVTESCDGLRAENLSAAASSRSAESWLAAESSAHLLDVGWLSLKESPPSGRAWSARSGGTVLAIKRCCGLGSSCALLRLLLWIRPNDRLSGFEVFYRYVAAQGQE